MKNKINENILGFYNSRAIRYLIGELKIILLEVMSNNIITFKITQTQFGRINNYFTSSNPNIKFQYILSFKIGQNVLWIYTKYLSSS